MQANRDYTGTRTDKGRDRQAQERGAYIPNAPFDDGEPVKPGTSGLALFDDVAP
jgi:hypothetical protein